MFEIVSVDVGEMEEGMCQVLGKKLCASGSGGAVGPGHVVVAVKVGGGAAALRVVELVPKGWRR